MGSRANSCGPGSSFGGPRSPEADLVWYEPAAGTAARDALHRAHETLLRTGLESGSLTAAPDFSSARYHPHMTIAWRASGGVPDPMPRELVARGMALVLYRYAADPHRDAVSRNVLVHRQTVAGLAPG